MDGVIKKQRISMKSSKTATPQSVGARAYKNINCVIIKIDSVSERDFKLFYSHLSRRVLSVFFFVDHARTVF